jgi:hypothetical protein
MKFVLTLLVGLMVAGAAAAYSDFSLTAPTTIQSYFLSLSDLSASKALLLGVAVIMLVGFLENQKFIDRKGLESDTSTDSNSI